MPCPHKGNPWDLCRQAIKRHQAHSGEVFNPQTPIIEFANALEFHTAQAFSNPLVDAVELPFDRTKRGSEVVGIPQDDPIEGSNGL
jgi:hypothetical protein